MSPTPQELEVGAKAYRQVRFYENYGARNARQTPWILASCAMFLILLDLLPNTPSSRHGILTSFIFIPAAIVSWVHDRMAKESYANQKLLLQLLEEKYGDALP